MLFNGRQRLSDCVPTLHYCIHYSIAIRPVVDLVNCKSFDPQSKTNSTPRRSAPGRYHHLTNNNHQFIRAPPVFHACASSKVRDAGRACKPFPFPIKLVDASQRRDFRRRPVLSTTMGAKKKIVIVIHQVSDHGVCYQLNHPSVRVDVKRENASLIPRHPMELSNARASQWP